MKKILQILGIIFLVGFSMAALTQAGKTVMDIVELEGYSSATDSSRFEEVDPLDQKYLTTTLADVTNGADATYYYYVDMNGYRQSGTQFTLDGGSGTVTVTMECSIQDDGTAPASCAYQDITSDIWGVANITASDMWIDDSGALGLCKYVRYKVVAATGAVDDADWTIYFKKLY